MLATILQLCIRGKTWHYSMRDIVNGRVRGDPGEHMGQEADKAYSKLGIVNSWAVSLSQGFKNGVIKLIDEYRT